jgi:hypothetical protein
VQSGPLDGHFINFKKNGKKKKNWPLVENENVADASPVDKIADNRFLLCP